jgi:hypothetical protein
MQISAPLETCILAIFDMNPKGYASDYMKLRVSADGDAFSLQSTSFEGLIFEPSFPWIFFSGLRQREWKTHVTEFASI